MRRAGLSICAISLIVVSAGELGRSLKSSREVKSSPDV
jgi:hypothetical protein